MAVEALRAAEAQTFVRYMERYGGAVGIVRDMRDGERSSLVVLDLHTGRPQDSAVGIKAVERIGVEFSHDAAGMPMVRSLRADFPVTGHQHLSLPDRPPAICIDERPWNEARLTWGPPELLGRVLNWFRRAAAGELHDAAQPVDPNLITSGVRALVPRRLLDQSASEPLIAVRKGDGSDLEIMGVEDIPEGGVMGAAYSPLVVSVPPEAMTRMRFAPCTLAELASYLADRGIDLPALLAVAFIGALDTPPPFRKALDDGRLLVVLQMPVTSGASANTQTIAFLASHSLGQVAINLGVAHPCDSDVNEPERLNVARAIGATPGDASMLSETALLPCDVHVTMDRIAAARYAGTDTNDARRAVLIGAGAIGSHLATCLAREGRYRWTIIDPDVFLPHNAARHVAGHGATFHRKADVLATYLTDILDEHDVATTIPHDVSTADMGRDAIDAALHGADLVIDATASLAAARFLNDHPSSARRVSAFFNPVGTAVVVLAETENRDVTLRDLEAQFLQDAAVVPAMEDHYSIEPERIAYSGSCGAITSAIPQSHVMVLSGLAATGIVRAVERSSGSIRVWFMTSNGAIGCHERDASTPDTVNIGGWTVSLDAGVRTSLTAMRDRALPEETGGVLTGTVDIPARRLHILHAAPAPIDSEQSPNGFVRGTAGVGAHLDRIRDRTMGQVRYLGEWHSHPDGIDTRPSPVDLEQLDWLSATLGMEALPGLMAIVGEDAVTVAFGPHRASIPLEPEACHGEAA
ncbi:ThiF family adenylyltransferase [Jannaschia rubra]|uniref:ThiF family adenylyltransferase n=1 Tax=Jannaschia rubra TaxID=282197 RepID=UPI0011600F8E|nr:ThiF family adenylyltransferase [Jannaschia rubra]